MRFTIKIDVGKLRNAVTDKTRLYANQMLYKHMIPYIPRRDDNLFQSVNITADGIEFLMPYAHYQWNGISRSGNPLNYSKEKHPLACDHWEEQVKLNHYDTLLREIKDYILEHQNEQT